MGESDFEAVFAALEQAGVRYLVVGGVAVVLHGHLRTTVDLDLVVQLEPANARAAMETLSALGLRPRAPVAAQQFADPLARQGWIRDKGLTVFSLWSPTRPGLEVDVFVEEPFDFDAVYARSSEVVLDHSRTRVIGLSDLIALKRRAGRNQDLADIEALEIIASHTGVR